MAKDKVKNKKSFDERVIMKDMENSTEEIAELIVKRSESVLESIKDIFMDAKPSNITKMNLSVQDLETAINVLKDCISALMDPFNAGGDDDD